MRNAITNTIAAVTLIGARCRPLITVALVGSALALGLPSAGADFTVDSWGLGIAASDSSGSDHVIDDTVLNPFSETRIATGGSGSSNTTTYDFEWGVASGSFNWDFDHQRANTPSSGASSGAASLLKFTVTEVDLLYDFSGSYSMTGEQLIAGIVVLSDVTAGSTLFFWAQRSTSTLNESFVVGQAGDGDLADALSGSPSGTLLAGHEYSMWYSFGISANQIADSGATAIGDLHLDITPVAPPVIVIDGCDTGVENQLLEEGLMGDLIWQCAEGVVNHGQYVQCVAHLTNLWKGEGLIGEQEKEQIQSCAGQAEIP